ncbi:ThuA domain-containing protein [Limisphaera ngatamarikiensis]|uniref:ThuA domain-containing protein n=1 Tax=Limisphaera ngatamarikiensis TaxID=1324935 RepID=A0A6M1RRT4_9BACT|nr:ThuA domain-containing protein [Limisphaera ngatamarikiensis]NGO40239.1 ThuA domain-containing protein [Limisphaera ngatamarikiensis]
MNRLLWTLSVACLTCTGQARDRVLIVADEFPAMEYLAEQCRTREHLDTTIVPQNQLPTDLASHRAVIVYIHRNLDTNAEQAFIRYTRAGGRLIVLHHSISSAKRKNPDWFRFLGVELPQGDVSTGGYKWIEPATVEIVNLAPDHFITSHKVAWPHNIPYRRETGGEEQPLPGMILEQTEVYLNHTLIGPRTPLLGLKYRDPVTGRIWMQDRAGWIRPADSGWIVYFQPGHSIRDFQQPAFTRLILNAILYQP